MNVPEYLFFTDDISAKTLSDKNMEFPAQM